MTQIDIIFDISVTYLSFFFKSYFYRRKNIFWKTTKSFTIIIHFKIYAGSFCFSYIQDTLFA